jgi:hypothetical protein
LIVVLWAVMVAPATVSLSVFSAVTVVPEAMPPPDTAAPMLTLTIDTTVSLGDACDAILVVIVAVESPAMMYVGVCVGSTVGALLGDDEGIGVGTGFDATMVKFRRRAGAA